MPPPRKSKPRSPEHAALGEAIRRLRLERGWSQEELAERMGSDFNYVGSIERGQGNPNFETLLRVADALEARLGEIMGLADRVLDEGRAGSHLETSDSDQTSSTSRSQSDSTPRAQR